MADERPNGSRAKWQHALTELRTGILTAKLSKDEIWSLKRLKEKHGIEFTRAPLRQALERLEADGLVENIPKSGFRIRTISPIELTACLEARVPLECMTTLALKTIIDTDRQNVSGRMAELQNINARMESLRKEPLTSQSLVKFLDADVEFHACIARMSGFPGLVPLLSALHNRILHAIPHTISQMRMDTILDEHGQIIQALNFGTQAAVKTAVLENLNGFKKTWSPDGCDSDSKTPQEQQNAVAEE